MGANTDFRSYADVPRAEIIKQWEHDVSVSQYENGHSYSGCVGMLSGTVRWFDLRLEDRRAAAGHITEIHEKWAAPMATSYMQDGEKRWLIGGWCSS